MSKKLFHSCFCILLASVRLKPCPNLVRPLASQVLKNCFEVAYCFVFVVVVFSNAFMQPTVSIVYIFTLNLIKITVQFRASSLKMHFVLK